MKTAATAQTTDRQATNRQTTNRRRLTASVAASLAGVGGLAALATAITPAQALPAPASHSVTYTVTGAPQYFTVPPNVSLLTVTADGAAGGSGQSTSLNTSGGSGGHGGRVTETVPVYGGELLQVYVGSAGQAAGAPYGAGGGGDAAGGASGGGSGGFGDGNDTTTGGSGGGGGAASEVDVAADPVRGTDQRVLAVAAGGGGGGGSGAIVLYNGGPAGDGGNPAAGGTGGTGPGAGGGGAGGTGSQQSGSVGGSSPTFSQGGGGGGGGGGYNPLGGGGGTGGSAGGAGAGGGGGGGGGLSFAAISGAAFGTSSGTGNGDVTIGWTTPATGQVLSTNPSPVTVGGSFTLTDTVTSSEAAGPAPTGSVSLYRVKGTVPLATVPLTATGTGTARAVFPPMVAGPLPASSSFYAVYSGDANYPQATSDPFTASVVPSSAVATVNPSALAFGTHPVGSSASKTVTITNDGSTPLTLTSVSTTGQPFAVVHLTCAGQTKPIHSTCILRPHQRATVTLRFHPKATGSFAGSLVVTDNASNSPQAVTLTGSAR